ncbi:MAG: YceD family protein [Cognatishimia sp.]
MSGKLNSKTLYRVADLSHNQPNQFLLEPKGAALEALADQLDILDVKKLRFEGELKATGKRDWQVTGKLGATVYQACVVTLDPVSTRIDTDVNRQFVANYQEPSEEEYELTVEENIEPLPKEIDIAEIMAECLALALPQYPRVKNAEIRTSAYTEPGKKAMTDEDARPFAGLASLRDKLEGSSEK